MPTKDTQIENLIALNDLLENYFRNTIIPQLFVDADLILKKFTPPAMLQFNLKKGDEGKSIRDIVDNFRYETIIEDIQCVIDSNEILEKEIQTTDKRWYQMDIIPYILLQTKKTNGVIITFVEITSRIKDMKEQQVMVADHETLLDTISHDIKTPLTSLLLAVEVLDKSASDPKNFKTILKSVTSSVKKMHTIINELTDSRKQQHKDKMEQELLTFEAIFDDVRLVLSENIRESEAVIEIKLNVKEITFSRRKLRSILYNLVINAIKYKSDHIPRIFITTNKEKEFTVITVKDNGMGIKIADREAIFSKYFRVENGIEGSGIGLYLVKEIVNTAGGKIEVSSTRGHGSEFKIYLPVK
ncbi:hypothetical protein BH09BAC2_BH09BAC2_22170 [soil metagenome]